jgi:putative flippase GtrA
VFAAVCAAAANILLAQASARLVAGGLNFSLARQLVFHSRARVAATLWKFVLLVMVMGAASYCLIQTAILAFGCPVIVAKLMSELIVYIANFAIQRDFVFREARAKDWKPAEVEEQLELRPCAGWRDTQAERGETVFAEPFLSAGAR